MHSQLPKDLYPARVLASFEALADRLRPSSNCVVMVDIDTLEPDVKQIRALKSKYSNLMLLAFSERKFHPEHKELISDHFFACLTQPVDVDEMLYLIKDA